MYGCTGQHYDFNANCGIQIFQNCTTDMMIFRGLKFSKMQLLELKGLNQMFEDNVPKNVRGDIYIVHFWKCQLNFVRVL